MYFRGFDVQRMMVLTLYLSVFLGHREEFEGHVVPLQSGRVGAVVGNHPPAGARGRAVGKREGCRQECGEKREFRQHFR